MAKSAELIRVHLASITPLDPKRNALADTHHMQKMNVYVDNDPRLKLGSEITLKDSENPEQLWVVMEMHEVVKRTDINVGWNNNI